MIKAQIDQKTLLKSIKRAAKAFGEDSAQATIRWGVATARELAKATQAWGDGPKAEKKQRGAIIKDAWNVCKVSGPGKPRRGTLTKASEVVAWIDKHRTGRKRRTKPLQREEKATVTKEAMAGAIAAKMELAGIAKGGWLGSGSDMAMRQRGGGRFTVGKGYLRYAQKHSKFGTARPARDGFRPTSEIRNKSAHSSSTYVLGNGRMSSSISWGLKKTIKWYEKAAKKSLDKA